MSRTVGSSMPTRICAALGRYLVLRGQGDGGCQMWVCVRAESTPDIDGSVEVVGPGTQPDRDRRRKVIYRCSSFARQQSTCWLYSARKLLNF